MIVKTDKSIEEASMIIIKPDYSSVHSEGHKLAVVTQNGSERVISRLASDESELEQALDFILSDAMRTGIYDTTEFLDHSNFKIHVYVVDIEGVLEFHSCYFKSRVNEFEEKLKEKYNYPIIRIRVNEELTNAESESTGGEVKLISEVITPQIRGRILNLLKKRYVFELKRALRNSVYKTTNISLPSDSV